MRPERNAARARVYRLLARVFQRPEPDTLAVLHTDDLPTLRAALRELGASDELRAAAERVAALLAKTDPERLARDYERAFEPSSGAARPANETAHAPETPQEGLTKNFELADIAGFYRAFGVEVTPGSERVDHVAAELEFMHLLAIKEALAEGRGEREHAAVCRDASAAFLRDHLGRWCAKLSAQLRSDGPDGLYPAAGDLLERFVAHDLAAA